MLEKTKLVETKLAMPPHLLPHVKPKKVGCEFMLEKIKLQEVMLEETKLEKTKLATPPHLLTD